MKIKNTISKAYTDSLGQSLSFGTNFNCWFVWFLFWLDWPVGGGGGGGGCDVTGYRWWTALHMKPELGREKLLWPRLLQMQWMRASGRLTSCGPCPSCRWPWGSGPAGVGQQLASCWTSSGLLPTVSSFPPRWPSRPRGDASAAQNDFAAGRSKDEKVGSEITRALKESSSSFLEGSIYQLASLSASFSSASFSFTLWTNICLISSSLFCSSTKNSWRLASYVCCRLRA